MNDLNLQWTRFRRIVVLDIETVSLDTGLAKGALDGLTGRIVCIGMLIDDGVRLTEVGIVNQDESRILTNFWSTLKTTDLLVGHNLLDFDIPFVRQRSWILGIRPSREIDARRYYSVDVQDTLQIWTNWGFRKGVSLDALGRALGCGQKTGNGMEVADWWANRNLRAIKNYCLEDVRLTYRVYCKLRYQEASLRKLKGQPQAAPAAGVPQQQSDVSVPNRGSGQRSSMPRKP